MGARTKPKIRAGARRKGRRGPPPSAPSPKAVAGALFDRKQGLDGLEDAVDAIANELYLENPKETRQRSLAGALRACKLKLEIIAKRELPEEMARLAEQLRLDREERARLEQGVDDSDEGADLPPVGSAGGH